MAATGAVSDGAGSALDSAAERARVYRRLRRRNLVVGLLRWAVPGLGVVVAGLLIAQIYLANLAQEFGVGGVRFDRESLIVDTPRFSGVMADGTRYSVAADTAVARLDNAEVIDMTTASIVTRRDDGYEMRAWSDTALLDLTVEQVTMPGVMTTLDSDGISGEIEGATVDWPTQTLTSTGRAAFVYPDGATVTGDTVVYDAEQGTWLFTNAVYTAPGDGGVEGEADDDE